ncbi:MAG: hypothetical protein FWD69_02445 [Polyangiaceae bacterium]|nr:hypothetical protein [Polyangiaceae bacterium]
MTARYAFVAPSLMGIGLLVFAACGGSTAPSASSPAELPAASDIAAADRSSTPNTNAQITSAQAAAPVAHEAPWPFGPAPTPEQRTLQISRLQMDPGPIRSNWVPPGKSERYGHAEALILAPYGTVRAKISDFAHYKDLAGPKFKKVSVTGRQGDATDIYFQLPIMKGLVTIWYVTRFVPPRPAAGGGEVVEGTFVKGNIRGMHIAFKVRPGPDDGSTILVCDLLLSLGIPAPQSNVDEELRDACGDALNAVRARTTSSIP